MTELTGVIERVYHASANFSAGTLRSEDGRTIRFRGKFCANYCDFIALRGKWTEDSTFGTQFQVESVAYALPETPNGLAAYLAKHEAFKGIGAATAKKIVAHAGSGENLEQLLRGDLGAFHQATRIPLKTLETLRDAWLQNSATNRMRSYLASFGLTMNQSAKLIETFGERIVGILKRDPYQLIQLVEGFGFMRVDDIALRMGTPKDHPGRIDAGILHALREEVSNGHTWTAGSELVARANKLLALDALDSLERIKTRGRELVESEKLVTDRNAVTFPALFAAEQTILQALKQHAWETRTIVPLSGHGKGLDGKQQDAFQAALKHVICVITGGAGTGKTTVISRLALTFVDAGLEVALCAPTGKAAKRIQDLLAYAGLDLTAQTIHRLLHYDGHVFKRSSLSEPHAYTAADGESELPACDVVILDEASMVDAPLFSALIERIDFQRTRLILVGDHNQLPPVGPGNVLRDILKHGLAPATILDRVHRQAGTLKSNSAGVLHGVVAGTAPDKQGWIVVDRFKEAAQIQAYLRDLLKEKLPKHCGYDSLREVQVLTPTHKGPLGTKELNKLLQFLYQGEVKQGFAVGDKVIQNTNDYEIGVMNGTLGYVQGCGEDGIHVDFEGAGVVWVERGKQDNLKLAYALTVHKTQGSEFPCVVLLMHSAHYFASRPLLYTGVTRAASTLVLVGDRLGIRRAARKNEASKRRTLLSRWNEAAKA